MFASAFAEVREVNVLVVGKALSRLRPLDRMKCQWHFANSHQEVSRLIGHTSLDIVLSEYTHERHAGMMALLAGLRVNMFCALPVESGCWWLPVLRNSENCLGMPAFRAGEFPNVLAQMVRGLNTDVWLTEPLAV
jgi:hypothetical protein